MNSQRIILISKSAERHSKNSKRRPSGNVLVSKKLIKRCPCTPSQMINFLKRKRTYNRRLKKFSKAREKYSIASRRSSKGTRSQLRWARLSKKRRRSWFSMRSSSQKAWQSVRRSASSARGQSLRRRKSWASIRTSKRQRLQSWSVKRQMLVWQRKMNWVYSCEWESKRRKL